MATRKFGLPTKSYILAVRARMMFEQGYRDTAMKQIANRRIYRVGEEEIKQILAFVRSLDVNKLDDDVMQQSENYF